MRLGPFLATRSLKNAATPTKETSQQTAHPVFEPTTQPAVARDFSNVPSPTPTDQLPSQANSTQTNNTQTSNGLDAATKIGLESGITLGILVLIVAIGLCVYAFSGRKPDREADEDAEIRSCVVEPGTPHDSIPELSTSQMYQTGRHRYEPLPNNMNPTFSQVPILPAVPQRVPVMLDRWGRPDYSSQPLMNAAELEDGYTWNRHPRMSELNPTPSTYRKSVYSRPAELDNSHAGTPAGNPKAVHLIPRKQVGSHAKLPRSEPYLGPT
ncbi:uncharacterized protein TRIVIDRAFT_219413 [Trichoderma virens Gv29-8]|uniref:Uncharacterized protein n=1 Tax=Hypocrea virens (strain Gv29-8 / FGSC 10586) TaxID=413071 RepID=G9MJI8_HYPVG|nr:uncharacterized protein TRIVIDRAFT_219413 [Trichoderma virens Gv29-8]EHK25651.1 hypothetical protein TRIVIDRAFT_219413 [Trichoderma virens Gv29-8]UKZ48530.1 hypothetical protein TrVGV298_002755 [Trichoderma virens]